jgi:hypothetical protein
MLGQQHQRPARHRQQRPGVRRAERHPEPIRAETLARRRALVRGRVRFVVGVLGSGRQGSGRRRRSDRRQPAVSARAERRHRRRRRHSLFVRARRQWRGLHCWGDNAAAQLGEVAVPFATAPVELPLEQ